MVLNIKQLTDTAIQKYIVIYPATSKSIWSITLNLVTLKHTVYSNTNNQLKTSSVLFYRTTSLGDVLIPHVVAMSTSVTPRGNSMTKSLKPSVVLLVIFQLLPMHKPHPHLHLNWLVIRRWIMTDNVGSWEGGGVV